ncbi:MAG: patatin-like phospholipase family protein [Defluviitaleaceae bacterium]|nr:patatin-like phospholipase family protein [Defluviitaleaceae bacterium]
MQGIALEGGGAKGAYHIGVMKALYEAGYSFDGFVGTSIGAINAAILAGGDFEKALEVWSQITMEHIFDEDEHPLLQLADGKTKLGSGFLTDARRKAIAKIIENRGINTKKIKEFLGQYVDEEKIRAAGKDFGLVTVNRSELKPYELMLEDIPQGQLFNYLMASAALPVFRVESIDDKKYLDGAFYNNCPYHLLLAKNYEEVIVIRTNAAGIFRKTDDPRVKYIIPSGNIGSTLFFSPEISSSQIQLGYYDGLRFARGLLGKTYCINPDSSIDFSARLMSLDNDIIYSVGSMLNLSKIPAKRMLFEKIIPKLGMHMKLGKDFEYKDFAIALLELAASQKGIERFCVYDYEELRDLVRSTPDTKGATKQIVKLSSPNIVVNKRAAVRLLCKHIL